MRLVSERRHSRESGNLFLNENRLSGGLFYTGYRIKSGMTVNEQ